MYGSLDARAVTTTVPRAAGWWLKRPRAMPIDDAIKKRLSDLCHKPYGLGGWMGLPYEQDGCIKFAVRFYQEMGIEADAQAMKQARNFTKVDNAQFGDVAVFRGASLVTPGGIMDFHIGVMLDYRRCAQCMEDTGGVGIIDVSRYPWNMALKGFYRHNQCI